MPRGSQNDAWSLCTCAGTGSKTVGVSPDWKLCKCTGVFFYLFSHQRYPKSFQWQELSPEKGSKCCLSLPSVSPASQEQRGAWSPVAGWKGPDGSTVRAARSSKRPRCALTFYPHKTFPGNTGRLIVTPGAGTEAPTGRGSANIWEMENKLFY